jgi:putative MATE family efflux protein
MFSLGIFMEVLGERLLQASGRTAFTLLTQGTGAVVNIILDPLFIFGFEPLGIAPMGIAGAAIATVIGQWVAAIMAIVFNLTANPDVQLGLKYLRPKWDILKNILSIGIPSIIMMGIGSVMNFGMNQIFLGFKDYGETAAGVFGIYFKLQSFVLMPLFGINNAAISIIAFNYGARQPKRITGTLKFSLGGAMTIMLTGLAVFQLLPQTLLGIFNPSDDFLALGISALRIVSLIFPLAAIGIALGASFQALGKGIYSTITSLCRQLIALLPVAYLLSLSGDVHLVWWAFPIAELVSVTVTLILFAKIYKQRVKPLSEE